MRTLLTHSLLGFGLMLAGSLFVPTEAEAASCNGWRSRLFPNCRSASTRGVPTNPVVPEPGAAALFALGAGLVALRARRA
jgi:hypothetical protein